jgi:hypothetical protein
VKRTLAGFADTGDLRDDQRRIVAMAPEDLVPIIISSISLLVSIITAYRTLLQRFAGKVWLGNYVVLNHINNISAVTLTCFFENSGAKLGISDDLRMVVEHRETGAAYKFFPIVMRDDYSIFEDYDEKDWLAFTGIILPPKARVQKYIVFKPLIDHFEAQKGHFEISVQNRWYGSRKWGELPFTLPFELSEDDAKQWNELGKALLLATGNIEELR